MQTLLPTDGGPIYAETDLTSFISEPWNALSSLAIVLPAVYWAFKLSWKIKEYPFLYFLMPLLFLGATGSVLFHAFRSSSFLLWMDVLPTAIVTLSVSIYFWDKILKNRWQVATVVIPFTFIRFAVFDYYDGQLALNLNYVITGFLIFFPIVFFLSRNEYKHYKTILVSVIFLSLSLMFRRIDYSVAMLIPMGSHFLWHIFSGIGAFYMAKYIYFIRRDELETQPA
ncbi:Ceramidase [Ekhidna lutea]|uniref:Ceramidase n=1 Tax=Ekhidna lutea TaxID=447679 RepID=A0A239J110_EKHLU|nr:ceramidase domain-containing protein [Ekhidna lutea]SNS99499.1 Ceramidase [Ekhidna lutea]